jgi:hypothetical protein
MLAELLIVTVLAGGGSADVYTDSVPGHWREWTVIGTVRLSGEDRCRARVDARRHMRGQHLTRGLPFVCMTRTTRKRRPDPAPVKHG